MPDQNLKPNPSKHKTLESWCRANGYKGVTKECMLRAFNSTNEDIVNMAKREKLKGVINNG